MFESVEDAIGALNDYVQQLPAASLDFMQPGAHLWGKTPCPSPLPEDVVSGRRHLQRLTMLHLPAPSSSPSRRPEARSDKVGISSQGLGRSFGIVLSF